MQAGRDRPACVFYPSILPHGRILRALIPRCTNQTMITILLLLALHAPEAIAMHDDVLLKARYTPIEGTDLEYGQGAIEPTALPHRPLPHLEWLILVEAPADPAEWQARLNQTVNPKH